MSLRGKKIVLGITGSIAAYKAADLTRRLVKAGAEVQPVMTAAAGRFIPPLTIATLAGREVLRIEYYPTQLFSDTDADADEDKLEARVEAGFNKTSLVTLWVDPNEHQIVQFTFDNVGSRSASDSASSGWSWSDSLFVFCHRLASVFAVIRNNHATKGVPRH